jgi:hypothetical protein
MVDVRGVLYSWATQNSKYLDEMYPTLIPVTVPAKGDESGIIRFEAADGSSVVRFFSDELPDWKVEDDTICFKDGTRLDYVKSRQCWVFKQFGKIFAEVHLTEEPK